MSTSKFDDTHNLVAFLEKPEESNGFEEIIDFLNEVLSNMPLVDKKKVIITETSIRSDLNLEDAGGTDCLPTDTIFEELARMGAKTTAWNEFSSTMASAIICLAINQKFNLSKDKGKAKIDEPEVPLNKKDQIMLDEELARRLDAEEKEAARLEREIEQEQGELTIEEKLKLFMELINESKRHFAKLRTEEKRRKPLKKVKEGIKSEGSKKKSIGKKRAGNEQKQESSKRQRMEDDKETDEHEEAEEDDETEMKKHMEIVEDKEEIVIDAIPLATKPPIIVEYKIVKEGQKGFYHLIRADGSSKRYSSMIKML
ncbi:hypothetical protein Tco_0835577 [Tanacetum coccineum]